MKPKISFDFDSTLEFKEVQELAKELKDKGYDICILTTRYSDPMSYPWAQSEPEEAKHLHDNLFNIATELGITEIHFTEFNWKTTVIDSYDIDIHIDDNYDDEIWVINNKNKAKAVHYKYGRIKETRDKVLELIF